MVNSKDQSEILGSADLSADSPGFTAEEAPSDGQSADFDGVKAESFATALDAEEAHEVATSEAEAVQVQGDVDTITLALENAQQHTGMPEDELERLRILLLQQERDSLLALQERLDNPTLLTKDISNIIAEAILLRSHHDNRMFSALQPTVEDILAASVKANPAKLANALFPLMGPAIRKAISESLRSMLNSLHKTLEMSFSWRGLRWRIEALRSGQSFSDVVMLHTLVYQVEQVFLIHSETGLMLGHAVADGITHQDGDLVSGMLTAIQDFVKDCFALGEDSLDTLEMGSRSLLVEKGPQASLALVVRGTLPLDFRNRIRDILDLIHIEAAESFEHFTGDMEPFQSLHRHLDDCLTTRYASEDESAPLWLKLAVAGVLVGMVAFPSYYFYQKSAHRKFVQAENAQMEAAVDALAASSGIVISSVKGNYKKGWEVHLARDPLAAEPSAILAQGGFDPARIRVKETPFASLEPEMVTARLKRAMSAPETAQIVFRDGVLHLRGSAPMSWILATTEKALAIPGVDSVDTSKITDPRTARLKELMQGIEHTAINFPLGKDTPEGVEMQKLRKAIDTLAELANLASGMGLAPTLIIYGHTDTTGSDKRNYELSEGRAKTLASMLYSRGVAMPIATYGFGSQYALDQGSSTEDLKQQSRRIELKIHLSYLGNSLVSLDGATLLGGSSSPVQKEENDASSDQGVQASSDIPIQSSATASSSLPSLTSNATTAPTAVGKVEKNVTAIVPPVAKTKSNATSVTPIVGKGAKNATSVTPATSGSSTDDTQQ